MVTCLRTNRSNRFLPPLLLIAGNGVTSILAAVVLDIWIVRPGPGAVGSGSITTLLPGLAYACATVMKVCLAAGALSLVMALGEWVIGRLGNLPSRPECRRLPRSGISAVALTPLATLTGALAATCYQRTFVGTEAVSAPQFQQIGRAAVFAMLLILSGGAGAAAVSLVRRERPAAISLLGFVVNVVLIALFCYFRFFALGFDQDTWAPRAF